MNTSRGVHWRQKSRETKEWRELAAWHAREQAPPEPLRHVTIYAKRVSCAVRPDEDNLRHSFKPIIDGLKGIITIDDDPDHVTIFTSWERAVTRGEQHISLVIDEGEPPRCDHCGQSIATRSATDEGS